jgi:hypothetical protein
MPAAAISPTAGLGSVALSPDAVADAVRRIAWLAGGAGALAHCVRPQLRLGHGNPIATATNTAGPPITTGSEPFAIAITPAVTQAPAFTSSPAATAAYRATFTFTVTTMGSQHPGSPELAGCPRARGSPTTKTVRPRSLRPLGRLRPGCTR